MRVACVLGVVLVVAVVRREVLGGSVLGGCEFLRVGVGC